MTHVNNVEPRFIDPDPNGPPENATPEAPRGFLRDGRPRQRRRRSDSIRNERRVVEAALIEFAEHGLQAPIPAIAKRAGVGKGTVYRAFPSKQHLASAVAALRLRQYTEIVNQANESSLSAYDALRSVVIAAMGFGVIDRGLSDWFRPDNANPDLVEAREELSDAIGEVLVRAQKEGQARDDVPTSEFMRILVTGAELVASIDVDEEQSQSQRERFALLMLDALRPGGSKLPPGVL